MNLLRFACFSLLLTFVFVLPLTSAQEKPPQWPLFRKHQLDAGANESAAVADFNRDWPDVTRTRDVLVLAEERVPA